MALFSLLFTSCYKVAGSFRKICVIRCFETFLNYTSRESWMYTIPQRSEQADLVD
jgi:hypothetical protein